MNTGERVRDYSHEYKTRQKRNRRLHADLERAKAEQFKTYLEGQGLTFAKWLDKQIDRELERA